MGKAVFKKNMFCGSVPQGTDPRPCGQSLGDAGGSEVCSSQFPVGRGQTAGTSACSLSLGQCCN